jgi:hypothetical protein
MLIWFRVKFECDADRAKQVSPGPEGTFGDKSLVLHLLQAFLVHQVVLRCNKVVDPANSRPIEKTGTGEKEDKESKGRRNSRLVNKSQKPIFVGEKDVMSTTSVVDCGSWIGLDS